MRVKYTLWLVAFAATLLIAGATTSFSQTVKMGFVRDEKILEGYKAYARANEQWELEKKTWDTEAETKADEIKLLYEEYQKQRLIISDDKRKEREALIRTKQESLDAFTKQIYGPGGTAEQKQETLLNPIFDKVNEAIRAVAAEEGYDVIFTMRSGLGYIKESYDVTSKVLARLEKLDQ